MPFAGCVVLTAQYLSLERTCLDQLGRQGPFVLTVINRNEVLTVVSLQVSYSRRLRRLEQQMINTWASKWIASCSAPHRQPTDQAGETRKKHIPPHPYKLSRRLNLSREKRLSRTLESYPFKNLSPDSYVGGMLLEIWNGSSILEREFNFEVFLL